MAPTALLNHPRPFPDETLASWLWRLALCNYVYSPAVLLHYVRDTVSQTPSVHKRGRYELRQSAPAWPGLVALAEMTNLSVEVVYQHTLHRFAHLLCPPDREVSQFQVSTNTVLALLPSPPLRDFYTRRFAWCPACLAEERYVRLHWHVPLVACCEIHHCWLLEECPVCQARLKEPDILSGYCPGCHFCVERAVPVPVPSGDLLLVLSATVMAWLYDWPDALPVKLPDVSPAVLLRVLQGLRSSVQRAGNGWDFHYIPSGTPVPSLDISEQRYLTLLERGCLYTTAFRGLLDWPCGFWAFLDAYRRRPTAKEESGLRREFGVLYMSWMMRLWKYPAYDFVQEAFNDYLLDRVSLYQIMDSSRIQDYPELVDRFDYLDRKRARTYLDVCVSSLSRLVAEKNLTPRCFEGDSDIWFAREELERLKQKWLKYLTWPQVIQRLGTSLETVQVLAEAGLLKPVPFEEGIKEQKIYIDEDSVETLLQTLRVHTVIQTDLNQKGVLLPDVCIRLGSLKMNTAQLFKRVLAGKLPAYHPCETIFPLRAMWFASEDVEGLADTVKDEQNWFSKSDTKAYLGVGWPVLTYLLTAGFLQPKMSLGQKQFFCRTDVQALTKRWIFGGQVSRRLKLPGNCISHLVQQGILQPIESPTAIRQGCFIFDRTDFITWHQEHILIAEMRTLTMNMSRLQRCLKAQGIEPIAINPTVYPRREVMSMIEQLMEID